MTDELLSYYNRELGYLRRLGAEFAEENPKIAARLKLDGNISEDPHVSRLVESFAYLSARIRHKLDDDFPELTNAMLGMLYPHYQLPIPSMSIVGFESKPDLTDGYQVPRHSAIDTEMINGEACHFRTCYDTAVWPIQVESARLQAYPFKAPKIRRQKEAQGVLRLVLRCSNDSMTFNKLAPDELRFFLKGLSNQTFPLYELIFNNTIDVVLAQSSSDSEPVVLGRNALQQVGFAEDEGLIPYPARSFIGYRLLSEFFVFPEKFLFMDLKGLGEQALSRFENKLEIYIYLDKTDSELEHSVDGDVFKLGCTPIVNLYSKKAEPIAMDHVQTEYRVVPDSRRPLAHEVYSVDSVVATDKEGAEVEYKPFFSLKHGGEVSENQAFWHSNRRAAGHRDPGQEVFLAPVDLEFSPFRQSEWYMSVETTCFNRDLPGRLPFGGGQPHLQLSDGSSAIELVRCLTQPSATTRSPLGDGLLWRLISHLSLNHLSISSSEDGTEALKEILKLYDFADSAESRDMVDGVVSVKSRPVHSRAPGGASGSFIRGMEITIEFDAEFFAGNGIYLFASVLERFLALYCSINSFTQLVARVKGREQALCQWVPRAGEQCLL